MLKELGGDKGGGGGFKVAKIKGQQNFGCDLVVVVNLTWWFVCEILWRLFRQKVFPILWQQRKIAKFQSLPQNGRKAIGCVIIPK